MLQVKMITLAVLVLEVYLVDLPLKIKLGVVSFISTPWNDKFSYLVIYFII